MLSYLNTVSVGRAGVFAQQTGAYPIEVTFLRQQYCDGGGLRNVGFSIFSVSNLYLSCLFPIQMFC